MVKRREREGLLESYGDRRNDIELGNLPIKLREDVGESMRQGGEGGESFKLPWLW